MGHAGSDDAGVYRLRDDLALVLTVDYFTPIVDDPFDYGRIAATNSLSDVYAMGGTPIAALNIAGFPEGTIPPDALREILRGGAEAALAAGVAIVGGHTVDDKEVKYGLAVVGTIDPDRIITNAGSVVGDVLVLTKPLGTGVLATALKNEKLDDVGVKRLVGVMTQLNKEASELMLAHDVHACTDITGFGLIGHANNLARESGITVEIRATDVPLIDGALDCVRARQLTGGARKNRAFLEDKIVFSGDTDKDVTHLLFDPQTAGGLLIALPEARADALVEALRGNHAQAARIGVCAPHSQVNVRVV